MTAPAHPEDQPRNEARDEPRDRRAPDVLAVARLARFLERACTDLTLAQYRVLALVADGERHASRVATALALGKPTVSASVEALAERGLLLHELLTPDDAAVVADAFARVQRALDARRPGPVKAAGKGPTT